MENRWQQSWVWYLIILGLCPLAGADEVWDEAASRIRQHRQADAKITVTDSGRPVAGSKLEIRQQRHAFLFGCNIFQFGKFREPEDEQAYRSRFAELLNFATIGFYWPSYERLQGQPNHEYAEQVARWCQQHQITTKGHPLAWNYLDPNWLPGDTDQIRTLQMARITDCVSRFRGLIDVWDVVNEATHYNREGNLQRSPKITRMWDATGQVGFVNECFQHARRANRDATLLINDYRTDPKYVELIEQLAQIEGQRAYNVIGIQSHMHGGVWSNEKIWEVCERFARFGVPLHFTEMTVLSGPRGGQRGNWESTPAGEAGQAEDVARIYTMLFSHPAVAAITWWDLSDRNAWQGAPAGLLDKSLKPKPAYQALQRLIKDQWWTTLDKDTDEGGQCAFRGFLGDYVVRVSTPHGKKAEAKLTLQSGQPNELWIELNDK